MFDTEEEYLQDAARHLEWCADEAMKLWDVGDNEGAINSFFENVAKHPGTAYIAEPVRQNAYRLTMNSSVKQSARSFYWEMRGFAVGISSSSFQLVAQTSPC